MLAREASILAWLFSIGRGSLRDTTGRENELQW
jgi:hypothetical protein